MATSRTTAPPQASNANYFTLQDHSGKIKVTYRPFVGGPIRPGLQNGPLVEYSGPQGDKTFTGADVNQQDTPVGQMISVTLKPQNDTGSTSFAFCLPPVQATVENPASFKSFCVTVEKPGLISNPGSLFRYETERLAGTGKIVPLAL